ncbi:glycosyltransferase [Synechococcus elongatus]|uniref:Glycosyltransferase n=1 Tax=Synechococcus elongatus PCC 11802 TaxID=2283154 RepID=A0AAT9K3H3_SYNEL|nr:glycosyltransferase [Synechococcus elongatus]QFZ91309.1 glycosyltransferase family 4 protein [Synechococcus elongatus PCC 11802]
MKVLVIADPHIPVPPTHYGGAERIVHLYAEEFTQLGHTVHLMAGPSSRSYGNGRLHIHHAPTLNYWSRARRKIQFQAQSLWTAQDCDVIYNHGRFDYLEALLRFRKPILNKFPNPIDQQQINFAERRIRSNVVFHCISENQRAAAHIQTPTVVIPNPIDTRLYQAGDGSGGYLAFLGRLTRNKGVDIAIAVACKTQKKLIIAGNISKEEGGEAFFQQEVEPHLDGEHIRWIGPVNDRQKQELLSQAEALLFPIRWEEPFGMVMVEALACGTPVIATRRASTPEVIEHGRTGFLCAPAEPSVDAFVTAIAQLPSLNRADCRIAAETRFDVRQVTPRVLNVLTQLVTGAFA